MICLVFYNYYLSGFSTFSFLTFFFPILSLFNLFFLIYWLLKLDLKLLLPLIVFLIISSYSISFYNLSKPNPDLSGLHMMSYNVRLFNHYKWIDNDNIPVEIEKFIIKKKPPLLLYVGTIVISIFLKNLNTSMWCCQEIMSDKLFILIRK